MVRMVTPIITSAGKTREGRGFSIGELEETGLNPGEARHLGIPVDTRRGTVYDRNIEALKEWVKEARETGFRIKRPKQKTKAPRNRARRGLTSSGKKTRGLRKKRGLPE